jgi:flavin-dependent dehydrogenase
LIQEPAINIPVLDEADVVVVGGGPAGISAAVSAARNEAAGVAAAVALDTNVLPRNVNITFPSDNLEETRSLFTIAITKGEI